MYNSKWRWRKKRLPSCLGNGHLTILKANENSNFNLLTHYLILQNCIFIACASMETNKKKLFPITNTNKKMVGSFFSLLSSTFFISLSSLDSYLSLRLSLTPFNLLSVFVRVYSIDGKFRSLHWRAIPQRRTRRKKIENLCVVYMIVYCHIFAAHTVHSRMARTDGIIYSMICAFHFIDANPSPSPSLLSSSTAREIDEFRFEN